MIPTGGRPSATAATIAEAERNGGSCHDSIPCETATEGGWMFVLAQPPDGVDDVTVLVAGQGISADRPG